MLIISLDLQLITDSFKSADVLEDEKKGRGKEGNCFCFSDVPRSQEDLKKILLVS